MQVKLGEKIRALRMRDGRKQEDLAKALGVTNQAVSRWEANGGYPDMQMIPAIANYFHITIDELFGYNNDRNRKIEEYKNRAIQLLNDEKKDECIALLRGALAEFPAESILQTILASALYSKGYEDYSAGKYKDYDKIFYEKKDGKYTNDYWEEAVFLYEELLETDNSHIVPLISLYSLMGEYELAKKVAGKQQLLSYSREIMMAQIQNPAEAERFRGIAIWALLHELRNIIDDAVLRNEELKDRKEGLEILATVGKLYEALVPDKKYGRFHSDLCMLYLDCAGICSKMQEYEKEFYYFDSAFEHYRKYEEEWYLAQDMDFTGPLFTDVKHTDLNHLAIVRVEPEFLRYQLSQFPEEMQEKIKLDPKYKGI